MKKLVGSLLIVIFLCFGVTGFTQGARAGSNDIVAIAEEGNDIIVTGHTTSPRTVDAGSFTLNITLQRTNETSLTDVYLIIDETGASSFSMAAGGAVQMIDDVWDNTGDLDTIKTLTYKLVYDGGDSTRLPIKIKYKKGVDDYEVNTYLAINAIPDSTLPKPDPIDTTKYIPKLSIVGSSIPSGNPGDMISVPIQIKNTSYYEAKNITITPQLGADNPFEANSLNLSQSISSIAAGGAGSASYNFTISDTAAPKSYPVTLKLQFDNGFGDIFTAENTIYIKVTGQEGSAKLLVKDISCSNPIILPGDTTSLNISLINSGSLPLKDIKLSIIGLKEDGLTLYGGSSSQYLSYLNKGEEATQVFNLAVSKKMTKGNYALSLKLEYKDNTGKEGSDEQQFFIPVQGDDNQETKTVPKIILDQYSSSPSIVKAGQNFQLNMSFLNTSEAKLVKNIKIYLTVNETSTEGANIFTPVNSSNTFFIDSIDPKGKVSKSLTMYTIPDAKQKTYTISANFEYEDSEGNEYKATELIGVPVTQITNVDTSEIAFPPEAYPGQPVPVSFDFYNTGKTLLRNFMIKLEGDFQSQNGSYFVGNFDVGASDHYEASIIPSAPGQLAGAIVISFDDPTGQKSEIRKDFSMNVMEMPTQQPPGMDPGIKPEITKEGGIKGLLKNKFLLIGLGIIAVAIVAGIIIRKRIIKKREDMTLDE